MNQFENYTDAELQQFLLQEELGRKIFSDYLNKKNYPYVFTEDKYNGVDCFFTGKNNTQYVVEIKVRNKDFEDLFMEEAKLNKLMEHNNFEKLYINIIKPTGEIIGFKIDEDLKFRKEYNIPTKKFSTKLQKLTTKLVDFLVLTKEQKNCKILTTNFYDYLYNTLSPKQIQKNILNNHFNNK